MLGSGLTLGLSLGVEGFGPKKGLPYPYPLSRLGGASIDRVQNVPFAWESEALWALATTEAWF